MNDEPGNLTGRLGSSAALTDLYRLGSALTESADRKGDRMHPTSNPLADHAAVTRHGDGVGSENLANFTECLADYAASRIKGTGALQYSLGGTNEQRFESLSGQQLCDELIDELADVVSYASMLAIKVLAFRNGLPGV